MSWDHNAQLVRIAKDISSMIQHAIKTTMKPVVEKLESLCARVDVLEDDVVVLRKEIDRKKAMVLPIRVNLNILAVVADSPIVERSPPDDWCIKYSLSGGATTEEIQEKVAS
ncbi:hypothetical protein HAX54_002866 [Datura stramonium]|uniref:Uncharacterized protein n=1 Tax=Datura stramonium TaxID=4076 RepID=A0ABS8T5J3_DATST|nr:hypothetical protein [Datura stramonium]